MYEVYAINQAASAARGLVLEAARERGDPNIYNIYMGSPLFLDSSEEDNTYIDISNNMPYMKQQIESRFCILIYHHYSLDYHSKFSLWHSQQSKRVLGADFKIT